MHAPTHRQEARRERESQAGAKLSTESDRGLDPTTPRPPPAQKPRVRRPAACTSQAPLGPSGPALLRPLRWRRTHGSGPAGPHGGCAVPRKPPNSPGAAAPFYGPSSCAQGSHPSVSSASLSALRRTRYCTSVPTVAVLGGGKRAHCVLSLISAKIQY